MDQNLDVYYELGYVIATTPEMTSILRNQYQSKFGHNSWGVTRGTFDDFCAIRENGDYMEYFDQKWGDWKIEKFRLRLNDFFYEKKANVGAESVWRLHQMLQLQYKDFGTEGPDAVFAGALTDYVLVPDGDSDPNTQLLVRKRLYKQTLEYCEDPMDLHRMTEVNRLRLFVDVEHKKKNIKLDVEELNLVFWRPPTGATR